MRIRTFLGIVAALAAAVVLSYLTQRNVDLLLEGFRITGAAEVPLYAVFLALFLLGFLPPAAMLVGQRLRRELARRRDRRHRREEESLEGVFRRAVDLETDGQLARAERELEAVLAARPEDYASLLRYGEVLRRQGRSAEALEVHRRASALFPGSVALLYHLADDYAAAGEGEVAREIRNRILRDFPGFGVAVLRRRRNAALAARDWPGASRLQEEIESALEAGAEGGGEDERRQEAGVRRGLAYQRGVELLEREEVAPARAAFQQLLREEPGFLPAALMLGEVELEAGDEEAALRAWREGFETTGSPVFLQRIEDHFIEGAAPARAIETLRALIAGAERDLLPRFYLGRLYHRLEMHEEALRVLDALRDDLEASPIFHYLLGRIHERRGEMRRAVESLLTCLEKAGFPAREYRCRVCGRAFAEWHDRCERCGSWNAVDLDIGEEGALPEGLRIREAPVWTVYEDEEGETGA